MAVLRKGAELPHWTEHVAFVRRHRFRLGTLVVLGLLIGLAWSLTQQSTWTSTASVSLAPVPKYVLPTGTGLAAPAVSIDTDAQLLSSPQVVQVVAEILGTGTDEAGESVSVSASPNSHVLHVSVTASSAPAAAAAADAAAAALVRVRRNALGALHLDQLRLLRLWVGGQEDLLAQEQSTGVVIPTTDEQFDHLLHLRTGLQELEEARLAPGEVVNPARPAEQPDPTDREVQLTSGAMLGLLAGCLLASMNDRRRRPVAVTADRPSQPIRPKDAHHVV